MAGEPSLNRAVTTALSRRRWVPEFRFISHYHDARGYIAAQAQNIREYWDQHGRGDRLLANLIAQGIYEALQE